jgi:hypothetical protein
MLQVHPPVLLLPLRAVVILLCCLFSRDDYSSRVEDNVYGDDIWRHVY